ncbi:Cyclohexanone monooxygenase protein [Rutstroemia sp. NJR-2017a BVV2]|nr:Cyclohexanone monooxygenase protein [Rutstroemia sp. NJR-2017a BVV2]
MATSIATLPELPISALDPQTLAQKYHVEREKRIRDDGLTQYREPVGEFGRFQDDTLVDANVKRDPIIADTKVLIVGGGYGGLLAAARLAQEGVTDFRILEKGGGYGGTWYWNQYPGAQCDIESYIYLPLLEELGYVPTEKYARTTEIHKHIQMLVEKYDLEPKTIFSTEVKQMKWEESALSWTVDTNRDDVFRANFVITATGILHKLKLPGLEGMELFEGKSFHTSRWDYGVTGGDVNGNLHKLADKRVGVIGTGATAVQMLPHLANHSKHVYIFQRTPSTINVRNNKPTPPKFCSSLKPGWQEDRMENFNDQISNRCQKVDLVQDGWTQNPATSIMGKAGACDDQAKLGQMMMMADFALMERIRARVDELVEDKETAEKLKPWYSSMCKRPCFHDEYLQLFNRDNVQLVDTNGKGVDRVSERGVVFNGQEYPVDVLIYSTGFEVTTAYQRRSGITVIGRDGQILDEKWKKGPSTFHGFQTAGFPNYFFFGTTQSGVSANFMYTLTHQSQHTAYIIAQCKNKGIKAVEPSKEAEEKWVKDILTGAGPMMTYFMQCTPGYFNGEGHVGKHPEFGKNAPYGAGASAWAKLLADWRKDGEMDGLVKMY